MQKKCKVRDQNCNPRSPVRERPRALNVLVARASMFQSTLPREGATLGLRQTALRSELFQSTLPREGATVEEFKTWGPLTVSIHAPP